MPDSSAPSPRPDPAEFLFAGLPEAVRQWLVAGNPARAPEGAIAERPSPASLAHRLRFQFPFTEAEARTRAADAIANMTDDEWAQWRESRALDWIELFGERRFARSFLGNLLRRTSALRERAPGTPVSHVGQVDPWLHEHVMEVDRLSRSGAPIARRRHRVVHRLRVKADAVPVGEIVRCWLPFPSEVAPQRAIRLLGVSSRAILAPGDAIHRTAYLEQPQTAVGAEFWVEYDFETEPTPPIAEEAWAKAMDEVSRPGPTEAPWLAEDVAREPWTPELRALAAEIVAAIPEGAMLARAEAVFSWVSNHLRYAAEFEYGVLPCLSRKGLETREGDCGVYASLIIVLCRIAGVPARWRSGWFLKPKNGNMHDWAEFWAGTTIGWRLCDPTYAPPRRPDPAYGSFYKAAMDGFRMVSNLGTHGELHPSKRFERSEPLDFQRGEAEWQGGNLFFDTWQHLVSWSSETLSK